MVSEEFPGSASGGGLLAGFSPGSRVAGYRLEELVGAGGMAVVFRAVDERLGRQVALKILAPALASDEAFRQRFIRESRAAAAVDDPHIIPVHEAGESGGVLFIAMRYVPGRDVRSLLHREGPLPPGRAAAIISPVASALDAAHAAGLIHRDVKPANMLLDARPDRPDHVYLSDFGLSKGALSSVGLTGSGQYLGTPNYTAPEQIEGKPVDGRTDQYALACAAFEMLTGQAPFQRDDATAVIWAHMSTPPPPLTSLRPELPPEVNDVFARALAKAPADRYGRCADFAEALRQALGLTPYSSGPGAIPAPDQPVADHPATRIVWPASPGATDMATPSAVAAAPASPGPGADAGPAARVTGEPALPATRAPGDGERTIAPRRERTPGQDTTAPPGRRRGRGKVIAIWTTAAAAVLAAGIVAAVGFLGQSPKPRPASRASSHQQTAPVVAARVVAAHVLAGGNYAFKGPQGVAADGTHIWVANYFGNSVTELNAGDGSWVQTLSGRKYGFNGPLGIVVVGSHIWVTDYFGNSVTELNVSDGSWVRTVSGGHYGFNTPDAITSDGTHIWVANYFGGGRGGSVTELNASDGSWVQTLSGRKYGFADPDGIAAAGGHIWVTNFNGGNSVTELNASDGSLVQKLSGGNYAFYDPDAVAADGTHVWVTDLGGSVTELNASDGSLVRKLSGGNYAFNGPDAIAVGGGQIWVTNSYFGGAGSDTVTELNASDGSWVRTLSAQTYGFNNPVGIVADGTHVYVTNSKNYYHHSKIGGDSVTELILG